MFRIAAVYRRKDGSYFDFDYYVSKHLPIVREKFGPYGLMKIEVDNAVQAHDGAPSPFFAIGYLYFPTLQHFQEAYAAVGREVVSDIVKYTDVKPEIQLGETNEV